MSSTPKDLKDQEPGRLIKVLNKDIPRKGKEMDQLRDRAFLLKKKLKEIKETVDEPIIPDKRTFKNAKNLISLGQQTLFIKCWSILGKIITDDDELNFDDKTGIQTITEEDIQYLRSFEESTKRAHQIQSVDSQQRREGSTTARLIENMLGSFIDMNPAIRKVGRNDENTALETFIGKMEVMIATNQSNPIKFNLKKLLDLLSKKGAKPQGIVEVEHILAANSSYNIDIIACVHILLQNNIEPHTATMEHWKTSKEPFDRILYSLCSDKKLAADDSKSLKENTIYLIDALRKYIYKQIPFGGDPGLQAKMRELDELSKAIGGMDIRARLDKFISTATEFLKTEPKQSEQSVKSFALALLHQRVQKLLDLKKAPVPPAPAAREGGAKP